MARWRDRGEPEPMPAWIGHDGFVPADWAWPADLELPGWLAEHRAHGRWVATRHRWLQEHPDAGEILLEQLRERCREKRGGRPLLV